MSIPLWIIIFGLTAAGWLLALIWLEPMHLSGPWSFVAFFLASVGVPAVVCTAVLGTFSRIPRLNEMLCQEPSESDKNRWFTFGLAVFATLVSFGGPSGGRPVYGIEGFAGEFLFRFFGIGLLSRVAKVSGTSSGRFTFGSQVCMPRTFAHLLSPLNLHVGQRVWQAREEEGDTEMG